MFKYCDFDIQDHMFNEKKDLKLDKTYNLCVNELGLQQSKRDQIIAFYIAIISFVIPSILKMELGNIAKVAGFLALYELGSMLSMVIVRYRIYKEIYWITCRTISQLYNFEQTKITKALVQHLFYITMKKNVSTVIVFKKDIKNKVDVLKSFRKVLNSAETILYEVMVLMASMVLWIAVFILAGELTFGIVLASIITLLNLIYWNCYYYKHLTKIYDVISDGSDKSFNATYSKAWFLHSFVD